MRREPWKANIVFAVEDYCLLFMDPVTAAAILDRRRPARPRIRRGNPAELERAQRLPRFVGAGDIWLHFQGSLEGGAGIRLSPLLRIGQPQVQPV